MIYYLFLKSTANSKIVTIQSQINCYFHNFHIMEFDLIPLTGSIQETEKGNVGVNNNWI